MRPSRTIAPLIALAALAPAAPAAAFKGFQSPSHNIGCYVDKTSARCDIKKRSWSPGPQPKSCPSFTGWGQGLIVAKTGRGHIVCAGDTALNNGPDLDYGDSLSEGRFTCTSRTSGITCRNRRTGHGFTIARERYRLF